VSDYLNEDEQADAVKRWLRENAIWLAGGLLLGIGSLVGWNQWQAQQAASAEQASAIYEQLLGQARLQRVAEAEELLGVLGREHGRSTYLDLGRMAVAAMHLERNLPEQSAAYLEQVANGRGPAELRHIARLRLARVLAYQDDHAAALALLDPAKAGGFAARYHDVRGDVHASLGEHDAATREYELALQADQQGLLDRAYVQAKLDELRVAGPEDLVRADPPAGPGLFQ